MEVNITSKMPWEETFLIPVGDIQHGGGGVDLSVLEEDIKRGMDLGAYFIGLGDYVDVASPSGRAKIKGADYYDSVLKALGNDSDRRVDELMDILAPTVGRWWGILQGHHFFDHEDGTTTDTRLAEKLGAPFLGDSAFVRARWQRGSTTRTLDIYATHGTGSGQTQSAPVNKLEKFAGGVHADLYLINHYARRGVFPADVLRLNNSGRVEAKTVYYMATGGYMKAYEQGSKTQGRAQGSYVEKGMMKPTSIGGGVVKFLPRRRQVAGEDRHEVGMRVEV